MKLLQVASGDLWAGAEVQVFYLCRQLFARGVDLHVVLFNEGILADRLRAEGVPVAVFEETKLGGLKLLQKLIRHIRQLAPAVIHTHRHKENVMVGLANAITVRAACVRTVHGAAEIHEPWWNFHKHFIHWSDLLAGRYLQQAIIAVSYPLGDMLASKFAREKIHVIENSIDADYVGFLSRGPAQVHIAPENFNIAIIGRLVPVKRQDLLVRGIQQVLVQHRAIHLYVIGDGPLRNDIAALIELLGLSRQVTLTGALDPVYPVLARMNLLVMPSDHEGLPMTLLEAMALSIPVVAHAVGGIIHAVKAGELACLVSDHTDAGYASAISVVIGSYEVARERAEQARHHVKQQYDIGTKYMEYIALYKNLLGEGSSRK